MNQLSASDWIALCATIISALAVAFAGWQVRMSRQERKEEREHAVRGVSVSWKPEESPDHARSDGSAQWLYVFTVHNPGRMPIDDVEAVVHLGTTVRRIRYSGRRGEPTSTLTLRTSVLPGGSERAWNRRIEMPFDQREGLRAMHATVTFRDVAGTPQTNTWPRSPRRIREASPG